MKWPRQKVAPKSPLNTSPRSSRWRPRSTPLRPYSRTYCKLQDTPGDVYYYTKCSRTDTDTEDETLEQTREELDDLGDGVASVPINFFRCKVCCEAAFQTIHDLLDFQRITKKSGWDKSIIATSLVALCGDIGLFENLNLQLRHGFETHSEVRIEQLDDSQPGLPCKVKRFICQICFRQFRAAYLLGSHMDDQVCP